MKSKKNIYVLLPLVLLIWCVIVYKLYLTMHKTEDKIFYQEDRVALEPQADTLSLHYALLINYPDPFALQHFQRKEVITTQELMPALEEIKPEDTEEPLPDIQYAGMIEHAVSAHRVAMLIVDGQSLMVKAGTYSNELQIKAITSHWVELIYKGKKLQIKLQPITGHM